jgi:hypothetical protein
VDANVRSRMADPGYCWKPEGGLIAVVSGGFRDGVGTKVIRRRELGRSGSPRRTGRRKTIDWKAVGLVESKK